MQVKRIDDKARLDYAKMTLLVREAIKVDPRVNPNVKPEVHAAARKTVSSFAREMGMQTEKDLDDSYYDMCVPLLHITRSTANSSALVRRCCVYMGRMDAAFLYPLNLIQWSDYIQNRDPLGNIDKVDYLVMINTASMMLRGLGEALGQYRNLAEVWGPMAEQALREKGRLGEVDAEVASWQKV